MRAPVRGEVWLADLDPTRGREQAGRRPVLVLSVDRFNAGPAGLIIAIPLTSRLRGWTGHVPIVPPEGGLRVPSAAMCEALRSLDRSRLGVAWGTVTPRTLARVEDAVRIILGL
ncbi:MAG: type II toxin-antitoxin system PemK/MazF family toxin [Planctomycetales bacterium]|nr:type II toxin-antitoxin system PemK/MazF family toxin [Planctomycetales bacterium]